MKRMLVATDGSDGAERAIDYAASEAKAHAADLLIVNVISGSGLIESIVMRATSGQQVWLRELLDSLSAEILTKAQERAHALGVAAVQLESRTGSAADAIVALAKERNIDLIVVGKRGIGRTGGLLLGSVSQKLVSLAELPVTVVP